MFNLFLLTFWFLLTVSAYLQGHCIFERVENICGNDLLVLVIMLGGGALYGWFIWFKTRKKNELKDKENEIDKEHESV